eukprot:324912_1
MSSTVQRVHELESRFEESQKQVQEYAAKLQDERRTNMKQLHTAKEKTDKLFNQIEQLKGMVLDGQHQKEMMQEDINANNKKHKQEITRLQTSILQLQAQTGQLNEQLNNTQSQSSGNEQQKKTFMMLIQNLKTNQQKKDADCDSKIKELEALNTQQRNRFNDFFEQYKKKLAQSNKAGREYREKCIVVEAELEAGRKREKELLEQLATQETVFRIQLQELGQFIKEMKQREQVREKQQVEAYHKLLKERE